MCRMTTLDIDMHTRIQVADIKKSIIEGIIALADLCKEIDCIILFGSSLEDKCKHESDIDLAIISNVTRARLFQSSGYDKFTTALYDIDDEQTYDILQFNSIEELKRKNNVLCKDIVDKGKIIYRRKNFHV